MKFQVPGLKVGQQVVAEVSEAFGSGDALVSFAGDLVLVTNQTPHRFKVGEKITLRVMSVKPLSFKWMGPKRRGQGLDISI